MKDLHRFISSQDGIYSSVLSELSNGRKRNHWMWYIFPQIQGLGKTAKCKRYEIRDKGEAEEYIKHPILGSRLRECTRLVNCIEDRGLKQIFSYPDDLKFKSCMTLFEKVATDKDDFQRSLIKYCGGERDLITLAILSEPELKNWMDILYELV
jgi:uncharacterized protein (DUF1810 family)